MPRIPTDVYQPRAPKARTILYIPFDASFIAPQSELSLLSWLAMHGMSSFMALGRTCTCLMYMESLHECCKKMFFCASPTEQSLHEESLDKNNLNDVRGMLLGANHFLF